ncbi:N-methyl-D-aspartate receptor NMDAR2C subunit [Hydrogenophaga sp. 5NK40-0174]|uniref:HD domain-containing protein n=1 Tax=Hydrogenophaga sp. 5NK40-0174 TaxID=3127649 RepID=UPI00310625B9
MRAVASDETLPPVGVMTPDRDVLGHSWERAWASLELASPPEAVREQVLAAYGEPQRGYHTLQHLQECLTHLGDARNLAKHPGEVEIALWFHDAVYNPRGSGNEKASAEWAARVLNDAGASATTQQSVHDLIMATCHDALPTDADQQLLVDIDLSILGAAPERFAQYERQVRFEYQWVPGPIYGLKRQQVLRGFLKRERIYATDIFHSRWEAQARINLGLAVRGG